MPNCGAVYLNKNYYNFIFISESGVLSKNSEKFFSSLDLLGSIDVESENGVVATKSLALLGPRVRPSARTHREDLRCVGKKVFGGGMVTPSIGS